HAVLDDLSPAFAIDAFGKRQEDAWIDEYQAWLVERTDQVLPVRVIDAGLATDGRIDLRQKRCGNLHERYAPAIARCRETRQVADDATSEGQHRLLSFGIQIHQPIQNLLQALE